jgi:hypothetical protein
MAIELRDYQKRAIAEIYQSIRNDKQRIMKNLDEILDQHKLWLSGEGGKRADLSDANLSDASLGDANLSDAYLSGANLSGADLSDANLSDANLCSVNLSDANLSGANLSDANLCSVNLSDANLSGANLSGADLRDADLSGADLVEANLVGTNLSGADLRGAKLSTFVLPTSAALIKILQDHSESDFYDQSHWCGTNCCLAGAAGATIGNQALGVALVAQVLPDFNIDILYQSDKDKAIAELKRIAANA